MCSMYWNLNAAIACPNCGVTVLRELQTHWLGDFGSCLNSYRLGEPVLELEGVQAATIDGLGDRIFIDHCDACDELVYFGGRVEDEAVVELWPVRPHVLSPERSRLISSRIFGDE